MLKAASLPLATFLDVLQSLELNLPCGFQYPSRACSDKLPVPIPSVAKDPFRWFVSLWYPFKNHTSTSLRQNQTGRNGIWVPRFETEYVSSIWTLEIEMDPLFGSNGKHDHVPHEFHGSFAPRRKMPMLLNAQDKEKALQPLGIVRCPWGPPSVCSAVFCLLFGFFLRRTGSFPGRNELALGTPDFRGWNC